MSRRHMATPVSSLLPPQTELPSAEKQAHAVSQEILFESWNPLRGGAHSLGCALAALLADLGVPASSCHPPELAACSQHSILRKVVACAVGGVRAWCDSEGNRVRVKVKVKVTGSPPQDSSQKQGGLIQPSV